MKKIFISTGLAAISAAGIQSACADSLVSPKAWSVSGNLRGFYDDNYNISSDKKGSWGAEVSPSISFNLPLQQTDMGIRYNFSAYYYNDRQELHLDAFDYSHQLELWLNHAFNERWKLTFTDSLAYGQEPELLRADPNTSVDTTYRRKGDNFSNHANLSLDTQWTPLFGTSLHYGNGYYNYQEHGATAGPSTNGIPQGVFSVSGNSGFSDFGNANRATLSGLLDRVEQNIGLDLNWTLSPETIISAGYDFSMVNYIGNEPIAVFNYFSPSFAQQSYIFKSNSRDGMSHAAHVGLNHKLTSALALAMSVGVNYSADTKNPFQHTKQFSPVANASLSYTYAPGDYLQLGVSQGQNSTDVVEPGTDGSLTQYQNTTLVYADINHHITQKLSASLIGRFSYATFEGGAAHSEADYDYSAGINFNYQITRHFSADAGYNYDNLVSGLDGRSFVRNRVYMGLAASY